MGLAASAFDISLSKATTIANSLSLSNSGIKITLVPTMTVLSRTVTGIGIGTSLYSLVIGVKKDGMDWGGQDVLNGIAVAAGFAAFAITPIGWWTIALSGLSSGISIGIAIYDSANQPQQ